MRRYPRETGVALVAVLVAVAAGIANPRFLAPDTLRDLLLAAAPTLIVASAMTLVIVTGEIDISPGSLMGLLAVVLGVTAAPSRWGLPPAVSVALVLAAGAGSGLLMAVLSQRWRIPAIVASLALLTVYKGASELLLGGRWVTDLPTEIRWFGTGTLLGLPIPLAVAGLFFGLTATIAYATPLGRHLYAVGSNPDGARLAGLRPERVRGFAFVYLGLAVALATLVSVPRLGVVDSGIGVGFELLAIACVVVGGTAIQGGHGTLIGTLLAVWLLGSIRTVLLFLNIGEAAVYWERAIQGGLILVALILEARRSGGFPRLFGAALPAARAAVAPLSGVKIRWADWRHEAVLLGVLAVFLTAAGVLEPAFVAPRTQWELSGALWETAIIAAPMALLIVAAGIDLSVGSTAALASVLLAISAERGAPAWAAAGFALLAGLGAGLLNGLALLRTRVHPLIVTLATYSAFRGLAEGLSLGRAYSAFPESFREAGTWSWVLAVLVLGVSAFLLGRSGFGRVVRAVGTNEIAARFSGLRVDRTKLALYAFAGLAAAMAAVSFAMRRSTAKADVGLGWELEAIAAAVLGGVSIQGGKGSIVGVALGLVLLHEVRQFVSWRWSSSEAVLIATGLLLLAALAVSARTQRSA